MATTNHVTRPSFSLDFPSPKMKIRIDLRNSRNNSLTSLHCYIPRPQLDLVCPVQDLHNPIEVLAVTSPSVDKRSIRDRRCPPWPLAPRFGNHGFSSAEPLFDTTLRSVRPPIKPSRLRNRLLPRHPRVCPRCRPARVQQLRELRRMLAMLYAKSAAPSAKLSHLLNVSEPPYVSSFLFNLDSVKDRRFSKLELSQTSIDDCDDQLSNNANAICHPGIIPPTIYYARVGLELSKLVFRGQKMAPP